jgi:3-methyladenine DNA glycosylase AlkD
MMSEPESNSEVARLRRRIEEEYEAAECAMHGYAITARHEFITARMEKIGACHEQLKTLVGEATATSILAEALEQAGSTGVD